ncbi:MAG: tRNA-dihydrouridine synthase, partial [Acidimicrobiales bacterium]
MTLDAQPVKIGPIAVWPPVVLAPMAGVTDAPFRVLCSEFGRGLYVNQMVTARALVENHPPSWELSRFHPSEDIRS